MPKKIAEPEGTRTEWPAGTYTLTVDKYAPIHEEGVEYTMGELIELDAKNAERLGKAGSAAPPDSHAGEVARKVAAGELPRSAAVSADMSPEAVTKEIAHLEKEEKERDARLKQLRAMRGDGS